jgi:hypothetical protein
MRRIVRSALAWSFVFVASCRSADGGGGPLLGGGDTGGGDAPGLDGGGCAAGKTACGGTCIDTTTDPANCGSCGVVCGVDTTCCDRKCVGAASCSFALTSLDQPGGFQNGGDYLTLKGAGFVAGMKVFVGDGRAAVRVVDATTATIQTPPGKVAVVDVKIVSPSGTTAILAKAFRYTSAGLGTPWAQKPMAKVRGENPGVTVLQDGRVLVAGGTTVPDSTTDAVNTAELYTRKTDKVVPTANTMSTARWQSAAITLLDGRALVIGGACGSDGSTCGAGSDPTLADLFDPKTDKFTTSKSKLNKLRVYPRAILMVDGRVFITSSNDPSVEIYDPDKDTFTLVAHADSHKFGFIVRLRDGRLLLGGGDGGEKKVETFDTDTGTFATVGALGIGRSMLTAHTLPDGRAIVIGGSSLSAGGIHVPLASMEAFDPKTNAWTTLPYSLGVGRTWLASALVRDGTILAMGGYTVDGKCDSLSDSVDQIDPVAGTVKPFAKLPNANTEWNAVTLLDGSVLGVGGGACGTGTALPDLDFLPGAGGPG